MAEQEHKVGVVVAAENQTKGTFQEIKSDAAEMAASVEKSGERAARGIEGIGSGADKAAQQLSRSEGSMIAALQRATEQAKIAAEAGGSVARAFEQKIELRGLDASQLNPYVQQLREAENALLEFKAQQAQAAGRSSFLDSLRSQAEAIGKSKSELLELKAAQMGVSSDAAPYIAALRETENAIGNTSKSTAVMRNTLIQLADSLVAGQIPWSSLVQQGAELVDMFGGVGNAAKAVGGYVVGLVNPFSVAAAAVGVLGVAYYQGSKEVDAYRKALVLSGNQAGTSIDQLNAMARAMADTVGTQGAAAAGLAEMAQKSKVGSDSLAEFTTSALLWEKATGQAVSETAKQFANLANDPLKASLALNDQMNFLTASVYDQIRALSEQGKQEEAAAVAQKAYSDAMKSRSDEVNQNLGAMERGAKGVADFGRKMWDALLDIGRTASTTDTLAAVRKELADLEKRSAEGFGDTEGGAATGRPSTQALARIKARIAALKEQEAQLLATAAAEKKNAEMEASTKNYVDASEALAAAAKQSQTAEEKRLEIAKQLAAEYEKAVKAASLLGDVSTAKALQDYMKALRANDAANQPSIDRNSLLDAIAHVESGGRQTDRSGKVVTSGAGALGMYQIMPSSGPHMAQLAGVEWSKARLEQDANYGRTLASAYIDYLMRTFDGDAVKVLTAYHSGQGTVKKAIAKAGPGGDWKQFLGPEGQQYANKVLSQFTQDARGNYNGLREGVAVNKDAIAEQQKIREMQDATAAATASMKAQQDGYNKSMADFIGMQATKAWEAMTPQMQKVQEQEAISKSNTDALMQSHQALESALQGEGSAWQDYMVATSGAANYTKEMAAEQARYDKVVEDSIKNGLTETTLLQAKEEHFRTMSALQGKEAGANAAALARQADQLEEANKHYGKSAIAIGEVAEQRMKDALAAEMQANGYSKLAQKLEAEIKQQGRVNDATKQSELNKVTDSFNERIRAANEIVRVSGQELQLMGLTGLERTKAIAHLEAQLRIQKDIDDLKRKGLEGAELATATEKAKATALAEEQAKVQQATVAEWQKSVDQYDEIFRKGFADMLSGGKNSWSNFTKSLITTFKTTVADQIYKMFAQKFVVKIVGALIGVTGSSAALAGSGEGGDGGISRPNGLLTDWSTWGDKGSSWLMDQGMSLVTKGWDSAGSTLMSLGNTLQGVDQWLKNIPGFSGGIGSAVGYLGSIYALSQGKYGTAVGSAIGTWILPGIGTMIGSFVGGMLDSMFTTRGPNHSGMVYSTSGASREDAARQITGQYGWKDPYEDFTVRGNTDKGANKQFKDTIDGLMGMYKALGQVARGKVRELDVTAGFVTNPAYKDEASYGYFQIIDKVTGELLKSYANRDMSKDGQEAWKQYVADLGKGMIDQLKSADIPSWMDKILGDLGDTPTFEGLQAAVAQIIAIDTAFKTWSNNIVGFANLTDKLQQSLLDAAGGLDKLTAAVDSFYGNYYTPEERIENQRKAVRKQLADLGIDLDPNGGAEAKAKLRKMIEDALAAGDTKLAYTLMALSGVFAQVADSADQAKTKVEEEAKAKEDAAKRDAEDKARKQEEERKKAWDAAMRNLDAAIGREKEYWTQFSDNAKEALSKASAYFDLFAGSAKGLRDSIADVASMQAAAGMVFIENALSNARRGLGLPDLEQSRSAIDAAKGGLVMDNYVSQTQLDYDRKMLAGQLDELGQYADYAKSDAQKQIDLAAGQLQRLDDIQKFWANYGKEQVDATLTTTAAVNALYKLLDPAEQAKVKAEKDKQTNGGGSGGGAPKPDYGGASLGGTVPGKPSGPVNVGFTVDGRAVWSNGEVSEYRPGEIALDPISGTNINYNPLNAEQWQALQRGEGVFGSGDRYVWDEEKKLYVKRASLAAGTNVVPGNMLARIHEGERIIPAADNRALIAALEGPSGDQRGMADVVAELQAVRQKLSDIEAGQDVGNEQRRRLADNVNSSTNGGTLTQVEVVNRIRTY